VTRYLVGMLVAALLVVAGYAHYRIPLHTATRSRALLTQGVLALVGLAFGYVAASIYPPQWAPYAFLGGFGVVHLPAAIILFGKRARGEGRS
jgi:hypothetical protein